MKIFAEARDPRANKFTEEEKKDPVGSRAQDLRDRRGGIAAHLHAKAVEHALMHDHIPKLLHGGVPWIVSNPVRQREVK